MMPKMVTEIAEFSWNSKTQHFESRIYVTDPSTGERQLMAVYATPPSLWMQSLDNMWEATIPYYSDTTNEKVVSIASKLGLKHQATSGM
jgi:hypothetical protein